MKTLISSTLGGGLFALAMSFGLAGPVTAAPLAPVDAPAVPALSLQPTLVGWNCNREGVCVSEDNPADVRTRGQIKGDSGGPRPRPSYNNNGNNHGNWNNGHGPKKRYYRRNHNQSGFFLQFDVAPDVYVEPRRARRTLQLNAAHIDWCYDRWQSYRDWDNTYQPSKGKRRQCISPYL